MIVCRRTRHLFSRKYTWQAARDFLAELRLQALDRPGGVESDSDSVLWMNCTLPGYGHDAKLIHHSSPRGMNYPRRRIEVF